MRFATTAILLANSVERAARGCDEAKRAFLIQGDERVGAAAETMAKLAAANIGITAAAATSAGSGRYGMIVWVAPSDSHTHAIPSRHSFEGGACSPPIRRGRTPTPAR
jgi:hypothetical protein